MTVFAMRFAVMALVVLMILMQPARAPTTDADGEQALKEYARVGFY
jgi:hypothetical protein